MRDVLIIGSGPAGLTAGIYAKRAGLDAVIAEKEYMGTGQIAQTAAVDNYPGLPGISGFDLGEALRAHAEGCGAEFYDGEALLLEKEGQIWHCSFDTGEEITAKAVIYAAGCRYRTLDIPGEALLSGKRVHFCALCDGAFYAGKNVAVIGGSRTAAADALYLCTVAQKVLILYRGRSLRCEQADADAIAAQENIEVHYGITPVSYSETESGVRIAAASGEQIEVSAVFEAVGMVPETALLQGIAQLDAAGWVVAGETGETSVPGLFAAGDVRAKSVRQAVTACADGANAAVAAEQYLCRSVC